MHFRIYVIPVCAAILLAAPNNPFRGWPAQQYRDAEERAAGGTMVQHRGRLQSRCRSATVVQPRTFPLLLSGARGDGRASWDLSAIKNFPITEKVTAQFRAECYNAWNHANFSGPNTDAVSTAW
jgi:hypothetical protein